jgi:hypothetical protein
LDVEGAGEIDFAHFMSHFEHVVMPAGRIAPRGKADPMQGRKLSAEVSDAARTVGGHLFIKYKKVSEAFNMLDLDQDGRLDKEELRAFCKSVNIPLDQADKLFQALDMELTGSVPYEGFMNLMSPFMQPPASVRRSPRKKPDEQSWRPSSGAILSGAC